MKKLLALAFSLFLVLSISIMTAKAGYAAPVQWSGNGHWYEAVHVEAGIDWFAAKSAAEAKGGYLATATSAEENTFLFNLISNASFWFNYTDASLGPWLGAFQTSDQNGAGGNWQWLTGEAWSYTNWASGEPNNYNPGLPGNADYLEFLGRGHNNPAPTWNDCHAVLPIRGYIIEYDVVPVPGAVLLFSSGLIGLLGLRRFSRS